jgi:hypothetical protein
VSSVVQNFKRIPLKMNVKNAEERWNTRLAYIKIAKSNFLATLVFGDIEAYSHQCETS